ncbi:MAG: hypothetical protein AB1485_08215 [Candidatus Thermoplasmatota archaeon]
MKNTKLGLISLVIALLLSVSLSSTLIFISIPELLASIPGFIFFIGWIFMWLGRKEFGKEHERSIKKAGIFICLAITTLVLFSALWMLLKVPRVPLGFLPLLLWIVFIFPAFVFVFLAYVFFAYNLVGSVDKNILVFSPIAPLPFLFLALLVTGIGWIFIFPVIIVFLIYSFCVSILTKDGGELCAYVVLGIGLAFLLLPIISGILRYDVFLLRVFLREFLSAYLVLSLILVTIAYFNALMRIDKRLIAAA